MNVKNKKTVTFLDALKLVKVKSLLVKSKIII